MPIDFGLLDLNALYKGAANTNAMMQRAAQYKAGALLNKGDNVGAEAALNNSGNLDGANTLALNLDEKDARLQKMNATKRQESTQLIQDTASILDSIRQKQGDAAVAPAFEQLVPMLKQRGATDAELKPFRDGLANNPAQMLQVVHQLATEHLKQYDLKPGDNLVNERGDVTASAPSATTYHSIPAGGSLIAAPGATPMQQPQATPQNFQEGQVYTDAKGNRARYSNGQWGPE